MPGKLISREDDLLSQFDHLEECFSYKEVLFKKFCLPEKTSCPLTESSNETPVLWASFTAL